MFQRGGFIGKTGRLYFAILIAVISLLSLPSPSQAQSLRINELLASNQNGVTDEDGDTSDWLEIYNPGASPVSLLGYGLTDDASTPMKWIFPNVTIPAGGFLFVWASDKDRTTPALHTNFNISAGGEFLGLYAPGAVELDALIFGAQGGDISYGRRPDGGAEWVYFASPTPGAANSTQAISPSPLFSIPGGYYASAQSLVLSTTAAGATIRYTLDASDPSDTSAAYTGPIALNSNTVVRARVFTATDAPSRIVSHTYLFDSVGTLPTLSIVTDPDNLWDATIGIYTNFNGRGAAWERPSSAEYMISGSQAFRIDGGIRIHGGRGTRWCDKKSFRFYFNAAYGPPNELEYPLFTQKSVDSFAGIVLRAGGHDASMHPSGPPIWTLLRDPVMNDLFREFEPLSIAQRPVKIYLNGQSWGIYEMVERIEEDFIEKNTGYDNYDLIKFTQPETGAPFPELRAGNMDHWEMSTAFLDSYDMSLPANYERAQALFDMDQTAPYNVLNMWAGNWDWPHMNTYVFRPQTPNGRWRWLAWDSDVSLNALPHDPNMYKHMDGAHDEREEWSTLHFRRLRLNNTFRDLFLNHVAGLLNTTLEQNHVRQVIDTDAALIRPDIAFETNRWGSTPAVWETNIANMKSWVDTRDDLFWSQTQAFFGLSGRYNLTLNPPTGNGTVRVNSITISAFPWTGQYFNNIPVTLAALPSPGYTFTRWEGASLPATPSVTLTAFSAQTIRAVFDPIATNPAPNSVIINEYWNNDDSTAYDSLEGRTLTGDWVELLVTSPGGADLRNWRLTNNDVKSATQPDSGSVLFPPLPELAALPQGTVILVIADEDDDNPANFAEDDLDPSDGRLIFYVGNRNLDTSTDPRFTIQNSNDNLVLLSSGATASIFDDVGVDFAAEGSSVTPASFGVAGDGVTFINAFSGIGDDDGAYFTKDSGGGYNNDNGADPIKDNLPGAGGWVVDPPAEFSGDDPLNPGSVMMLSPGRLNPGQDIVIFPTTTPIPTTTPTPPLNPSAVILRLGTQSGSQLYFAAADVAALRDERGGGPSINRDDASLGAARSYWAPSGYDSSAGFLDNVQCGTTGEVRDAIGYCNSNNRLSPWPFGLTLAKPDLSGPGIVFPLDSYVSRISSSDPRTPFNEDSAAYPAWIKYRIQHSSLLNQTKAYVWFRAFKPSRQVDSTEYRTNDDSFWIVGSPEPSETNRTFFYLADDNDGPGDNDGPDRSGTPADLLNDSGTSERGMEQWFWGNTRLNTSCSLAQPWCSSSSYKLTSLNNRAVVLHTTIPNDGSGNGILEFYLVGREAEQVQEALRLDIICISTAGPSSFVPSDDTWNNAQVLTVTHWSSY